jgi:4-aminobutyrate aminotransferase/(S)-3-amino-2-methylpropionate transaminase
MVAMELVKEGMPPDRTRISPSGWWPRRASGAGAAGLRRAWQRDPFPRPLTAPAAIVDEGLDLLEQALSASLA